MGNQYQQTLVTVLPLEILMVSLVIWQFRVDVIKLGNIKATKIDEETGKPLPNAKLKFEYNGTSK